MSVSPQEGLRALLRRVEEVRGLSDPGAMAPDADPGDTPGLLQTLHEVVDELERSHRRLIETNVQLVSLREVAGDLATTTDVAETTRTVTRYLARAFGFEHAFLLLLDREAGALVGCWTWIDGEREHVTRVTLPLLGHGGGVTRSFWLNRTVLLRDLERHPALVLPDGHPLQESIAAVGSLAVTPLQRHSVLPSTEPHELCGARCIVGDVATVAPPPGAGAERWAAEREERQRLCLTCELLPQLGVIGMARPRGASPPDAAEATRLESIALSVAPVVENARLMHELRSSERFRLHVLDSMASGLVAVNMGGEILAFNRSAQDLLGVTESVVRGRQLEECCGPDFAQRVRATLEEGREALREETIVHRPDGAPLPISLTTSLLRNEQRRVYGAIATFVDLTPLRQAEEHARSLDRLAALGRFTSAVAHEIRNPLTGIGAGVQYLAKGLADDAPQRENLEFIRSEIRRLDRIVQDLFDITHPQRLVVRPALLEQALRRALQSLDAVFAQHGVRVTVACAPSAPAVPHDTDLLQQVFINLLKNAAEAAPGGEIRVTLGTARGRDGGGPVAVATVRDAGLGIAPEVLARLFEPFFTTKSGGTGLGLYVCHEIVRRHGGELTVQSESGCGATFRVELPLEARGGLS